MIGAFVFIVAAAVLFGAGLFGLLVTLFGHWIAKRRLLTRRERWRCWLRGTAASALVLALCTVLFVEGPAGGGAPSADDWGKFFLQVASWAAVPGGAVFGGGVWLLIAGRRSRLLPDPDEVVSVEHESGHQPRGPGA